MQNVYSQVSKTEIAVSNAILDSYTGRFAVSSNFVLEFKREGGYLILAIGGQAPIKLTPESQNKFFIQEQPEITVEFGKGSNGFIDKAILTQGRILVANKIGAEDLYSPEKQYSAEQLKSDFNFMRSTLEKVHPRLYEFTPKIQLDRFFDTVNSAINKPMTEIEFRYLLLPVIAKIHDGHTTLSQSIAFGQYRPPLLPPFTLYYEDQKAFILNSADSLLKPGTEVLSINNISSKKRLTDVLNRVTGDGTHLDVQYSIINKPMNWFTYEIPYWFNLKNYKLTILNSEKKEIEIQTKAIDMPEFIKRIPPPRLNSRNRLSMADDGKTAILSYPRLDFPNDSLRNSFLNATFTDLRIKNTANLIIDLRGNGGGKPENAAYLLRYLMNKDFVYSTSKNLTELVGLSMMTKVDENRFKGKMYFLIDGGSFSSTSHLLSIVQYYKLGTLIGETSSGSYSSNTTGFPYPFPNSKLILNCPDGIYETAVKGYRRADGIIPNYQVKNTFKDLLSSKDRVLEFTKKLINRKSYK